MKDYLLNAIGGLAAILAKSVKNGAEWIKRKTVFRHQMRTQLFKVVAFKMNQCAAFLALQVKMGNFFVAMVAEVFKTGGILFAKEILLDNALRHKLFNLPVDCSDSDRNVLFLEISRHIFCSKMAVLQSFEAGKE